jgi:hypothetical protein
MILAIGLGVGFLGGLLGKGGSAIATPLLVAAGVPAMIAVAAPLPATVPGTLVAADGYRRSGLIDKHVVLWSLIAGVPATIVGAICTRWVSGSLLVMATDALLVIIGLRLLFGPAGTEGGIVATGSEPRGRIVAVAIGTGLAAGLLANSGGFLLAPLFIAVLKLPIKPAFGTSLAVAAVLAVPGTIVHLALGHIEWTVVATFALGSIPMSGLGARVAMRTDAARLERGYGVALVLLGAVFLVAALV